MQQRSEPFACTSGRTLLAPVSCRCSQLFGMPLPRTYLSHTRQPHRRKDLLITAAKKKGGNKGGQKKGKVSLLNIPKDDDPEEMLPPAELQANREPWQQPGVIMQNLLLVESFSRHVGRPLLEDVELQDIGQELWDAPFALLAHDLPEDGKEEDPVFSYANKAALELFEAEWDELIGKPLRVSAKDDAQVQKEWSGALSKAEKNGVIEDFSGWRQSLKGNLFQILSTTLFNISSPTGKVLGQGARIGQWQLEGGQLAGPEAPLDLSAPAATDLEAAEAAVQEQAAAVRELKEAQSLSNEDPMVKEAVAVLLQRKEALKKLQEKLALLEAQPSESLI